MSLFDFAKICLFSEVNGVVVKDGVPIKGAEVIQTVSYGGGEKVRNSTTTNSQGEFHFNALFRHSIRTLLPGASVYDQEIIIKYENQEIPGWIMVKQNRQENTELDGLPISLTCDINSEEQRKTTQSNVVLGICHW